MSDKLRRTIKLFVFFVFTFMFSLFLLSVASACKCGSHTEPCDCDCGPTACTGDPTSGSLDCYECHTCDCEVCDPCQGDTCFLAGTPIALSDGTEKPIEDVKVGDIVLSYDEERKSNVASIVKKTFYHPEEQSNGYLVINNKLKVTPNHPVQ